MSVMRRVALGFPLEWGHRRGYSFAAIDAPGNAPYFIKWDAGTGTYGEDFSCAQRDANGTLLSGRDRQYHHIRIAQFALHRHGVWLASAEPAARDDFLAQARYLRDHQEPGGTYRFAFPWTKYGEGEGWVSAMAQGEAISVLLRAERECPTEGFGDAALRASAPFHREIREGGVTWRSGEDVFFEEIAGPAAPHVLNGCFFALFGLWELARGNGDERALHLSNECAATLERWMPRFDSGWWSLYSLMRSAAGHPHLATLKYHAFHIAQLRVLARMFGHPSFDATAERWESYVQRGDCRARVLADTARSLPERFFKRDTVAGGART